MMYQATPVQTPPELSQIDTLLRRAGQTIMLILESDAGRQSDRTDDWYGWGDLSLMPADAARYAALLPQLRAAKLEREVP